MSTQQILGVVGGVVGAFFGYPQLGFVVGSLVGGLLTPGEKTEGPRVDDLKVQVSTYGAGIARLHGTERVGGNVVWSTDKIETSTTETQGKGGAPEHTSYRYFVHMGVVLCETPRDGSEVAIVQIFQDGKLIYDVRSGIPVGSAFASAENPYAFFVLYQGHADQLPDPNEELFEGGPGSVPAYRGVVRIRLNNIECPGGRIPQFSFVLSNGYSLVDDIYLGEVASVPTGTDISASRVSDDGLTSTFFVEYAEPSADPAPHKRIRAYSLSMEGGVLTNEFTLGSEFSGNFDAIPGDADIDAVCFRAVSAETGDDSGSNVLYGADGNLINSFTLGVDFLSFGQGTSSWSKRGSNFLIGGDNTTPDRVGLFNWDLGTPMAIVDIPGQSKVILTDSLAWFLVGGGTPTIQVHEAAASLPLLHSASIPAEIASLDVRIASGLGDTLSLWASNDPTGQEAHLYSVAVGLSGIEFTLVNSIARVDGSIPHPIEDTFNVKPGILYGWERVAVGAETTFRTIAIGFDRVAIGDVPVKEIITDLCERAGEDRFDVTDIPDGDVLRGYKLQNPASARADIDPLLTAFAIYIVDEDGVIKFKKYEDISSEATIAYDELGQAESGSEPADAMPLNRAQEIDMPRSVSVSYIEPTFDYQTASEKEVRQITEATEDLIVELPMATTSNHAKQVASMILFAKWRGQNTRSFKTSRKYAFLSPGDGVTVEYPRGTYRLWRITSMTDTGVLCEFNVEPGDAELYTQTAVGATGYVQQEVSPLPPPTRMVIGDWPLLRDDDNNPGIYTAFGQLGTGGRGATLYVGDDDASLQERGSVFDYCAIGVAETVLGDWSLNIVDQANTIIVNASADAFSSITYDALIASSTLNACAFGKPDRWEILQFATASYLGSSRWLIYDLKRGLRGTERNRGNHESGDTLVLLDPAGMLRPNMDVGSLDQDKKYRAVSLGRSPNSASSQTYANTGEGLRPFSPVNLLHSLVGSDVVFTWNRRTRLSNNWLAGIVPLGEAAEAYTLTLYTDGTFVTVKRAFAVTSATATYTAAQMATDGYTPGQPLYVRVRQISDTVGAGHELEATL